MNNVTLDALYICLRKINERKRCRRGILFLKVNRVMYGSAKQR